MRTDFSVCKSNRHESFVNSVAMFRNRLFVDRLVSCDTDGNPFSPYRVGLPSLSFHEDSDVVEGAAHVHLQSERQHTVVRVVGRGGQGLLNN